MAAQHRSGEPGHGPLRSPAVLATGTGLVLLLGTALVPGCGDGGGTGGEAPASGGVNASGGVASGAGALSVTGGSAFVGGAPASGGFIAPSGGAPAGGDAGAQQGGGAGTSGATAGGVAGSPAGAAGEISCTPGEVEVRACGACGTEERLCSEAREFLAFSPCQGELQNPECAPGDRVEAVPCYRCASVALACDPSSCSFASQGCYYASGPETCVPGSYVISRGDCRDGEQSAYPCDAGCAWGEPLACAAEPLANEVTLAFQKPSNATDVEVFFVDWDHPIPPLAGVRTLVGTPGLRAARWSPNGDFLAFCSTVDQQLYVVDLSEPESMPATGFARLVESTKTPAFAWAPEGARLAFNNPSSLEGLWVAEISGPLESVDGVAQELGALKIADVMGLSHLDWSPDGSWIVGRNAAGLVAFEVAGLPVGSLATPHEIPLTGLVGTVSEPACVWAPSGDQLACATASSYLHVRLEGAVPEVWSVAAVRGGLPPKVSDLTWMDAETLLLRRQASTATELFAYDVTAEPPVASAPLNRPLPRGEEVGAFRVRGRTVFFEADGAIWARELALGAGEGAAPLRVFGDPLGLERSLGPRWRVRVPPGLWDVGTDGARLLVGANWLRPEVVELFAVEVSAALTSGSVGVEPTTLAHVSDWGELSTIAIAPDSRHVAFFTKAFALETFDPLQLFVVDLEGARANQPQLMLPPGEGVHVANGLPNFSFRPNR